MLQVAFPGESIQIENLCEESLSRVLFGTSMRMKKEGWSEGEIKLYCGPMEASADLMWRSGVEWPCGTDAHGGKSTGPLYSHTDQYLDMCPLETEGRGYGVWGDMTGGSL